MAQQGERRGLEHAHSFPCRTGCDAEVVGMALQLRMIDEAALAAMPTARTSDEAAPAPPRAIPLLDRSAPARPP